MSASSGHVAVCLIRACPSGGEVQRVAVGGVVAPTCADERWGFRLIAAAHRSTDTDGRRMISTRRRVESRRCISLLKEIMLGW